MFEKYHFKDNKYEFSVGDYEDTPFYPLLTKLPPALAKKHMALIEAHSFSDAEATEYLEEVVQKRQESMRESEISDEDFSQSLAITPEQLFQSLETSVFSNPDNYLGTGMTAKVKSYTVPTNEGETELAIKYVITPTEKTISAEQEHGVLKEVERMKQTEELESKFVNRSKYIRVPHAFLHHKSEKLQCYGMEKIDGFTLQQAVSDSVPDSFLQALKASPLTSVPRDELMGYIERFFQTMHERHLHGDMKPANMMVSSTGMLYVIDFGQSIAAHSVPKGAEEQFENLKEDEIKIAKNAVRTLLKKLELVT